MKASEVQVGGDHYKRLPYQPAKLFAKTRCTAFQANIWKYISRYEYKDGARDIKKCMRYAQLAQEYQCGGWLGPKERAEVELFCDINRLSERQARIARYASFDNYSGIIRECVELLKEEYPQEVES